MPEPKTTQSDWKVYTGAPGVKPHNGLTRLPAPPPWRRFHHSGEGAAYPALRPPKAASDAAGAERDYARGSRFRPDPQIVEAVNTALYLRRPLLITGKPGNGKSSLVNSVARELRLGRVLRWGITSKSTLKDGLYLYDALARLEAQKRSERSGPGDFLELGALGTALLPGDWPRALLIDEIDKSDLDLPNDLLNVFEEGEYYIPELQRAARNKSTRTVEVRTWNSDERVKITGGHVRCRHFPFVVMTSNREREFPAAFYRRCVRIAIADPDETALGAIIESHFSAATRARSADLITAFLDRAKTRELATDQLLNAVYLMVDHQREFSSDKEKEAFLDRIYKAISGPEASR